MISQATDRPRVALVTGCGQGLGVEVACQLAERGCTVLATSRRAPSFLSSKAGIRVAEMDVTSESQVSSVVANAVSEFGRIDILVNNAGVYLDRELRHDAQLPPLSLFCKTLDVNLIGAVRTMAAVTPLMISQGSGVIVNVSSGMGRNVELAGDALYYRTSKAALTAISRCAARRLEVHGIVVNAVCPGWVRTRMGTKAGLRTIAVGAEGIVNAALEPRLNGVLLRDSEDVGW